MRKVRAIWSVTASTVGAVAMAAGLALVVPGSANAATFSCPAGNVCFYTGDNGTGQKCVWSVADPDWRNGAIQCSWAADKNVRSVFNNGQNPNLTGVVYYRGANYHDRVGCTRQGQKGNLAGTYKLRSHKWTDGHCG